MARTGRPTRLDHVHEYDRGGRAITVADAICRYVRLGNYLETACQVVGVNVVTVRGWLRDGALIHEARIAGKKTRRDMRMYDRLAEDFSVGLREAMAVGEARDVEMLARLAAGGLPVETVTEKVTYVLGANGRPIIDPDTGQPIVDVIERTTKTTHTLPDAKVLQWRLSRRFPQRWGLTERLEVDVTLGDDLDSAKDPVGEFLGELQAIQARRKEAMAQLEAAGAGQVIDVEPLPEP